MDQECTWQEHAGVRYLRYVVGSDPFAGQRAAGDLILAEPPGLVRVLVDIRGTPRARPQGGSLASTKALYARLVGNWNGLVDIVAELIADDGTGTKRRKDGK